MRYRVEVISTEYNVSDVFYFTSDATLATVKRLAREVMADSYRCDVRKCRVVSVKVNTSDDMPNWVEVK